MAAMDPSRRSAVVVVAVAVVAGAAMIGAAQAFREPLLEWVFENPSQSAGRVTMVIAAIGALLVIPLIAFAAYGWRTAAKMDAARARALKISAVVLVVGAVLLAATLWRLTFLVAR
jgi:hypothetical protein